MNRFLCAVTGLAAMTMLYACNNANAGKTRAISTTAVSERHDNITTNQQTETTRPQPEPFPAPVADMPPPANEMVVHNEDAGMLYTSKDAAQKHAVARNGKSKYKRVILTRGYFPEGSERKLVEWDVIHLSKWGYMLMQSEIYARHGLRFTDPVLVKHFKKVKWYKPRYNNVDSKLTPIEKQNLAFLNSPEMANKPRE